MRSAGCDNDTSAKVTNDSNSLLHVHLLQNPAHRTKMCVAAVLNTSYSHTLVSDK